MYTNKLKVEFDQKKSDKNAVERQLPFDMVDDFDFRTAQIRQDTRRDYGEVRWIGVGFIGTRLHVVAFKMMKNSIRVFSLRKANAREVRKYVEEESASSD